MDKYYGNVCELDIIFNFQKAYFILDELLLAGEMQESSKKNVLKCISQQDTLEDMEVRLNCSLKPLCSICYSSSHPFLKMHNSRPHFRQPLTNCFTDSGRGRSDEDHVANESCIIGSWMGGRMAYSKLHTRFFSRKPKCFLLLTI